MSCKVSVCPEQRHETIEERRDGSYYLISDYCFYHHKVATGLIDPDSIEFYPPELIEEIRKNRKDLLSVPHRSSRRYKVIAELLAR